MIDNPETARGFFARRPRANPSRARRKLSLELCQAEGMRLEPRTLLTSWTALGPAPIVNGVGTGHAASGRLAGVAASPTDPNTYYVAAAGGGVWKTTNAGVSWVPLTDSQPIQAMGAIAVAPSNGNFVYAGTGEANNSGDAQYGMGILRSTDGGASFTLSQGPGNIFATSGLTTSKIAVDPTNANIVYAAMGNVGGAKAFRPGAGVYKSTDGGVTWANLTASIETTDTYSDVEVNPTNPSIVYMAVGTFYAAAKAGVYESTNGGTAWTKLNLGVATTNFGRTSIAIAPSSPQTVYATVEDANTSGVLLVARTDDGGTTWTAVTPGHNYMGGQGWYDQWVIVSPISPMTVFVGGSPSDSASILESTDGGANWSNIGQGVDGTGPHADHHAAAFTSDGKMIEGNDGGIWRLDNASPSAIKWTDLNANINTIQFQGIALSPTDPNIVLGGSQDNGTERFTGTLGWVETDGGDGGEVRFSRQNSNLAYRVSPIGSFGPNNYFRKSSDAGQSWGSYTNGLPSSSAVPDQSTNFYPPFAIDSKNDQHLILGSSDLFVTTDGATTWTNLTAGKTGWTITNPTDTVAISTTNGGKTIYTSSNRTILVSTDGGTTWTNRNLPAGTGTVGDIEIDPSNDQLAYAVTNSFATSPAHVWRTTNGGATWTSISSNLPDSPTNAFQIDPTNPGTFYAGTDTGVYLTTNGGSTWNPMGTGLPTAQVLQLDLNTSYHTLGVATHGRGLYEISTQAVTVSFVLPATASPNPVATRATRLSALATDPAGEPSLTYTWSTLLAPSGTPTPTFSVNGTNAAKNDVASFFAAGVYTFQVKATNPAGQSATSAVTVTVNQTFTTLSLSPNKLQVSANGGVQLNAFDADQFGNPIGNSAVPLTWTLNSGGGSVSQTGFYQAPTVGTIASVSVSGGQLNSTAIIYVLSNPWQQTDVGALVLSGNAADDGLGNYTAIGSGTGVGGTADQFAFTNLTLNGNATAQGQVVSVPYTNSTAESGVMFRNDSSAGSPEVSLGITPSNTLVFSYRASAGGTTTTLTTRGIPAGDYVRIVRVGNLFTGSYSTSGDNWTTVSAISLPGIGTSALAGLIQSSGNASALGTSTFAHVLADSTPSVLATASANPNPVSTATTTLSVLGGDDAGEPALKYTWAATGVPSGAVPPTFATNGTNASKSDVVTFSKAGTYLFTVTLSNALGYSTSSSVSVSVVATRSVVKMTPTVATVIQGQTLQFITAVYDQFNQKLPSQPMFTYSIVAGGVGGKVSSTGLYIAPANKTGVDYVNVSGGGSSSVAKVTVIAGPTFGLTFGPPIGSGVSSPASPSALVAVFPPTDPASTDLAPPKLKGRAVPTGPRFPQSN